MQWSVVPLVGCLALGCALDKSGLDGPERGDVPPAADGGAGDSFEDAGLVPDGGSPDAGGEGVSDAGPSPDPTCAWTYEPLYFDPCVDVGTTPEGFLNLDRSGEYRYDTTTAVLTDPDGALVPTPSHLVRGVRVVRVTRFAVRSDATLRVVGNVPLVIAATEDAIIEGEIDASSRSADGVLSPGAGADPAACPRTPPMVGATCAEHGGSGGGGGGLGSVGGGGGMGADRDRCGGGGDGVRGGVGGVALGAVPAALRGGCPGMNGGTSDRGPGAGIGGVGGGAVHVTAGTTLSLTGRIHAGGAGGVGASNNRGGGGGGGSGGMVGLEAATIRIAAEAALSANGGAGGGGCESEQADPGDDAPLGRDRARGGQGEGKGEDGGDGGYAGYPPGEAGRSAERGGGGGGGGVGFVVVRSVVAPAIHVDAVFSPAFVTR